MSVICPSRASSSPRLSRGFSTAAASGQRREKSTAFKGADKRMANGLFALEPANMRLLDTPWTVCSAQACVQSFFVFHRAIPHNSKCRYGERGAADAKPKVQIILDAAKVSAASGGNSEPKQGQRSQSARSFCPRSTMRVPQPDIIEHFGNADAVRQLPERCLSRKAGIVRCCLICDVFFVSAHITHLSYRAVRRRRHGESCNAAGNAGTAEKRYSRSEGMPRR